NKYNDEESELRKNFASGIKTYQDTLQTQKGELNVQLHEYFENLGKRKKQLTEQNKKITQEILDKEADLKEDSRRHGTLTNRINDIPPDQLAIRTSLI